MRRLIYSNGSVAGRLHRRPWRRDRLVGPGRRAAPVPQRPDAGAGRAPPGAAPVRGDELLGDGRRGALAPGAQLEFARLWQELPKVVFSTTLERVEGNTRLATGGVAEEVAALRAQPGKDLGIGGAGLASTCIRLGLVDEYRLFVSPVVLGAGTPFFPALDDRIGLQLVETRTFGDQAVYLRYA